MTLPQRLLLAATLIAWLGCNDQPALSVAPDRKPGTADTAAIRQWTQASMDSVDAARERDDMELAYQRLEEAVKGIWWADTLPANGRLVRYYAWALKRQGRLQEALAQYEYAMWINDRIGPVIDNPAAFIYKPMASIYTMLGDLDKAIRLLKIGLQAPGGDALTLVECHFELGRAFLTQQQADSAWRHNQLALQSIDRLIAEDDPNYWRALVLLDAGAILARKGRLLEAAGRLEQAIAYSRLCAYPCGEVTAGALHELGKLKLQQGAHGAARSKLDEALELYGSDPAPNRERGKAYLSLSEVALAENRPDTALAMAQRAIRSVLPRFSADPAQHPTGSNRYPENILMEAEYLKAQAYRQRYLAGQSAALEPWVISLETAAAVMDSLQQQMDYDGSVLQFVANNGDLYSQLLQAYRQQGGEAAAAKGFALAERARAGVLRHRRALDRALNEAAPDLRSQERRLREDIAVLQAAIAQDPDDATAQLNLNQAWEKMAALRRQLKQLPGYAPPQADWPQMRQWLSQSGAVISYYYQPSEAAFDAWYLDGQRIQWKRLPVDTALLSAFIAQVSDPRAAVNRSADPQFFADFRARAQALYDALLRPLLPQGSPPELWIIPSGPLAFLPFDLLLTGPAIGEGVDYTKLPYLLRQTAVAYASSAALLMHPPDNSEQAYTGQYIGVLPDYSGYEGRLETLSEAGKKAAETAAARWPDSRLLLAESATAARFVQEAPHYGIVHFFGHAEGAAPGWLAFSRENTADDAGQAAPIALRPNPEDEALLSAANLPRAWYASLLTTEQLYLLRLPIQLAVLTGCRTGWGESHAAEGPLSISRAFHYAGCPSTLMSLWYMPEVATARMSGYFFEQLNAPGRGKAEALRLAKLAYMEKEDKHKLPFYWAGLVITGDTRPITPPAKRPYGLLLGLGGGLLLGGWLLFRRRQLGQ